MIRSLAAFLAFLLLAINPAAQAGTLHGQAIRRDRSALPADAVFEVQLLDTSRADAPAGVLGSSRGVAGNRPVLDFSIDYDDSAVAPSRRYSLRATVSHDGRLLYTTDRIYPAFATGRPPRLMLVAVRRAATPLPPSPALSPLRNTYWKLTHLAGQPVTVPRQQREPHLIFDLTRPRLRGSGGCNRFMGSFALDGAALRLSGTASTMMACPEGMDQERRFLTALAGVAGHRIEGDHLRLLDAAGAVLMDFVAVALR